MVAHNSTFSAAARNPNRGILVRKALRHELDFSIIPNAYMRDPRISFQAKGILAYLIGHIDGWEVSLLALADVGPGGLRGVRNAVMELEENGYLSREGRQRNALGQVTGVYWAILDPKE